MDFGGKKTTFNASMCGITKSVLQLRNEKNDFLLLFAQVLIYFFQPVCKNFACHPSFYVRCIMKKEGLYFYKVPRTTGFSNHQRG